MPTVSLCLGDGDDGYYGVAAATCPDDHHRFAVDSARPPHHAHRASPASLLAKAAAAAAATGTVGERHTSGSGADDGGCYRFGGGDGDCIRPAEAVQAGEEENTARPHGFRRWRPGENPASVKTGEQEEQHRRVFP